MIEAPYYPIVYIRGYAMTQAEVENTTADPYMGFNLGSTKLRQLWTGDVIRHIFESPLVRLMKDHGYRDIFANGVEISPHVPVPSRSVWIHRYYEPVSKDLGTGKRLEIEDYARGLHELIGRMRDHMCGDSEGAKRDFKVYLLAHSMGGLIARCYLQKIWPESRPGGAPDQPPPVDKVFTYATPHGGIDFRLVGNVPAFATKNNMDNFNEERMREYLNLPDGDTAPPVNSLGGAFPEKRFFSLVGTNHRDYQVAGGLARQAVGPMSDGLVQIRNAYVARSPRAFIHRSHSGHYGIVNSEEGYQNLRRFLFGDVQVTASLRLDSMTHPEAVQRKIDAGKKVKFGVHTEVTTSVRGARWDLHRRTVREESGIFVPEERLESRRPFVLFSGYLLNSARVDKERRSMGFSLELGVLVPDYEVDGFLFLDEHFQGGYLFRDKVNLELTVEPRRAPTLKFGFDQFTPNRTTRTAALKRPRGGGWGFRIPILQRGQPGLAGELILKAKRWQ